MAWSETRARARIARYIETAPVDGIIVEDFGRALLRKAQETASVGLSLSSSAEALLRIPRNRAITTNAAHIYANLTEFNTVLSEKGRETEGSHKRALEFLHAHYSACDNLIAQFDMLRVDFHGSRLHAVVVSPDGPTHEANRVRTAVIFAAAFRDLVDRLGSEYPEFKTDVRIGIDSGSAVALDGGKRDEPEPVFVGRPANNAAKLAAGTEAGVFLSPRARMLLGQEPGEPATRLDASVEKLFLSEALSTGPIAYAGGSRVEAAYAAFKHDREFGEGLEPTKAVFRFHHRTPPLKTVNFADHPPSRSIRMEMASIFADIDGYTAYVDQSIAAGRVAEAVRTLHVMRAEMAAVLRDDFGGRKVRFIGDCIHGVIAEGNASEVHEADTVRTAVMVAAALRSSFELCREMLPGADGLGLAIGVDIGPTPLCRIGLRGQSSVRVSASRACCVSELRQSSCDGEQTALGEHAYNKAPYDIKNVFGVEKVVVGLDYTSAETLFSGVSSPAIVYGEDVDFRAHSPSGVEFRAHGCL